MVFDILRPPLLGILVVVLGFNLTQRRFLAVGEQKRFASLGIAGITLLLVLLLFLIEFFAMSDLYAVPAAILIAGLFHRFRRKLFIFRTHCVTCGRPLAIRRTLYFDSNLCEPCEESAAVLEEGGRKSNQFSNGVPATVEEIDWAAWVPDEEAVLSFVRRGDELLLIRKKTGLGAGKVNAPGGRLEDGETHREAAIRETMEEVGVTPIEPEKRADLSFVFTNGYSLHGAVYFADAFSGVPAETREAAPFWCAIDSLPYDEMWEDDRHWLPRVLSGEHVAARFIFDGDRMVSMSMETVDFTS